MGKDDEMQTKEKRFISIGEAAHFTGLGQQKLRALFKTRDVKGYTTPAGQRRFDKESLRELCGLVERPQGQELDKVNYLYARVSSKKQSDDLERQVTFLQDWTANKELTYDVIKDIGSGINFKRKGLQAILDNCIQGTIGNVTVAHRDRLSRFAFELIESFITKAGGTVTVIEDSGNTSSEQELAEDLLSIVHIYSCRQMGKRSYSKRKHTNEGISDAVSSDTGTESDIGSRSASQ